MSEIILAEKPIAGNKLKEALGIKAIPAVGHLIELKPKARKWNPPYFDLEWVARKKEVDRLSKIVRRLKEADKIYIATDYDAEGQLIAYNILRECGISPSSVLRMKFSSLESEALVSAFQKVIPFDEDFALSAEIRHKLDWYFGMNISKALTELLKEKQGIRRYYLTPVGRVQTPVLHELVTKEKEISKFIAKDEWIIYLRGIYNDENFFTITNYRYNTVKEVSEFASSLTAGTIDRIDKEKYENIVYPPNKDDVVNECLRQGISSNVVDFVLQDLYLDGYLCYDKDTEILTEHGWKEYTKLDIGEKVLTLNAEKHITEFQPIKEIIIEPYSGNLITIKNRVLDICATPNHRILCRYFNSYSKKLSDYKVRELQKIKGVNRCIYIPVTGEMQNNQIKSEISDEMIKIIGWIVTEGYYDDRISIDKNGHRHHHKDLSFYQSNTANPLYVHEIRQTLDKIDLSFYERIYHRKHSEEITWTFNASSRNVLIKLFDGNFKEIPRWFLNDANKHQLQILFDTMMKGDGTKTGFVYRSYRKKLLDQFQEIGIKLGYRISINYKNHYACIRKKDYAILDSRTSQERELPYVGNVWCVMVDNKNVMVRRNGKQYFCGNSYPRTTSNQYKIHGVDTQKYLERLKGVVPGADKALGKEPREGNEVGVHPAMYPILPYTEKDLKGLVWNIIAEAFVKSHLPPEIVIKTVTYVEINGSLVRAFDNPDLQKGDGFSIVHQIKKRKSSPPARLSEREIYGWMVENNLGTVDTRTQTLTKLLRTYVFQTDAGLYTSSKGVQVCNTLAKMYSDIVGVALTRRFEKLIASVQNGAKIEPILEEGRETVTEIVKKIKEKKE